MGERTQLTDADGHTTVTDTRSLEETRADRVARIKDEARARILAICPEWQQANLTARAAELALRAMTSGPALTDAERAEVAAGQAIWGAIKAIRAASNEAEAAVMAAESNDAADAVVW